MKIKDSEFRKRVLVAGEPQEKKGLSDADKKTDNSHDPRLLHNEVRGRAIAFNDLLNVVLPNDSLKMFDRAWDETFMEMERHPEKNLLEGSTIDKRRSRRSEKKRKRLCPKKKKQSQSFP